MIWPFRKKKPPARIAPFRPEIIGTWFGTVDQGMRLELSATIDEQVHILLTILADDLDESLWLEVGADRKLVQIPVSLVRKALDDAVKDVHSESWYDRNLESRQDA